MPDGPWSVPQRHGGADLPSTRPEASGSIVCVGDPYPIRAATRETLRDLVGPLESAFAEPWTDSDYHDFLETAEPERVIAAFDGERPVATAGAYTFRMTVPGGEVGAAGVTLVGVMPSHQRRGILRAMMRHQLDDIVARGEPVAILWASQGAIYQRFGYGLATLTGGFESEPTHAAFLRPSSATGRVRLVDVDEAVAEFAPIYDAARAVTPGMLGRSETWWRWATLHDTESMRGSRGPKFRALLDTDGGPAGYAVYRVKGDWDERGPRGTLAVQELIGRTPAAERALWAWVLSIDLIGQVKGVRQPMPPPIALMLAEPRRLGLTVGDGLWLRLVDLPVALTARTYAAPGSLVLEVRDADIASNAGRWRVDTTGPRSGDPSGGLEATVVPTTERPDLVLDVADLGATYLGSVRFGDLWRADRIDAHRRAAVREADAMFASERTPWCPTMF
jgi:predicted acetyltransferase